MLINVGKSDTHDMSDIEALDAHFAKRRDDELAATMAAEAAKTDVARSAARATLVKRAGVATLLGGVGLGAALFGGSFLLKPKIVTVEKLTERIIERPVDRVVEKIVTKEVPGPERVVEKIVEKPVYVTKAEKDFTERPDYQAATNKGRIIKSKDGVSVFFDNDTSFIPVDETRAYDTDRLVSDFGFCTPIPNTTHFLCYAIHRPDLTTVPITDRSKEDDAADPAAEAGLSSQSCPTASKSGLPVLEGRIARRRRSRAAPHPPRVIQSSLTSIWARRQSSTRWSTPAARGRCRSPAASPTL